MNSKPKLFEKSDLNEPAFWGCCVLPAVVGLIIAVGLLWKFVQWAYLG